MRKLRVHTIFCKTRSELDQLISEYQYIGWPIRVSRANLTITVLTHH